jgi:transposase-like protein
MKAIYESDTEELAMEALMAFADKWQHKYPMIAKSWERN